MKTYQNSLYWKISATLLALLILLGVSYLAITGYTASKYYQEVNQRLYGGIADSTVQAVRPMVDGQVDTTALKDIMHSMMVINPSVEVYLLDTLGNIITYVAPHKRVKLDKVPLAPIKSFIADPNYQFIQGQDPRHPDTEKVFSAAPIREEGKLNGYLYIILASEEQAAVNDQLYGSYMLQLGTGLFLGILVSALILGLLAIWYLTQNLSRIIRTVRRFKEGDLSIRFPAQKGEFADLTETFNDMADTILDNINTLKSVENFRRELIANVSHDLRTPLAIMQGYIETMMIKEEALSPEERKRYLQIVHDSSERLGRLIAQLFEYSKLEAQQIEPQKEPFFITELAQDIYQKYQILAEKKNIEMHLDMDPSLPLVFADLGLVERVIQNLMDNALNYTPVNGKVRIELSAQDSSVEVKIADNGPGIPLAEQSYIFERYKKANRTSKKSKGAGLGLAIAKKILELHNSSISVQSKLNEGTAFLFRLPAYAG